MEVNGPIPSAPGFNSICSIEHFSDPSFRELVREVFPDEAEQSSDFPAGVENRRCWEAAMAVRAFRRLGILEPAKRVLCVGAGLERAVFHLTNHVAEVVAVDDYLGADVEGSRAFPLLLTSPGACVRTPFLSGRLTSRHMDGRVLDFPDASFDGVLCPGSIGRYAADGDVAASAFEMARVLKPGGVLTLTTDFLVMGPPGAKGWQGRRLFSRSDLERLVVAASGLELVDELSLAIAPATLETPRNISEALRDGRLEGRLDLPHLIEMRDGQVFTSAQITLRKGSGWPATDNSWAEPQPGLRRAVRADAEETAAELIRALRDRPGAGQEPLRADGSWASPGAETSLLEAFDAWDAIRARTALTAPAAGPAWRRALAFSVRTAARVRDLGIVWDRERDVLRALVAKVGELEARLDSARRKGSS